MAGAESDILDAAAGCSGLSTVKGAAPGRTQLLRIGNRKWFDGVFAEYGRALARDVVDPRIGLVAVISECAAAQDSRWQAGWHSLDW